MKSIYQILLKKIFLILSFAKQSAAVMTLLVIVKDRHSRRLERHANTKVESEAGFTLMELLIVLALVAIMSMIAVPIYRNYVQSAKITEGLTLASTIQLEAEVYYTLHGDWPENNASLGLPQPDAYKGNSVDAIALDRNQINVTFNNTIQGEEGGNVHLILIAEEREGGLIQWECRGENLKVEDLPTGCKA